ncbi:MAG: HlyD family efflux transporter periplasmic adaptor subunit [Myxococcota bacterium]
MIRGKSLSVLVGGAGLALALAVGSWWAGRSPIPDGLAWGNGRIEAEEVDVAARFAGHVDRILVEEGDLVETGQPLARMDTAEVEAELREAQAQVREAVERSREANAMIQQRESECDLAEAEYRRSQLLFKENVEPESRLDVKQSQLRSARAACGAAEATKLDAEAAIEAAKARVDRIQTQLDESLLVSPVRGRVLYRLARVGEVLPAGGKLLTLVDLSDVFMEIFLPSRDAARVAIGAEARIVLDGSPDEPIPASVSFVSPEAQFTPRQVETPSERDKLMFRVKVRIPADWVDAHVGTLKTGIRGLAYVRVEPGSPPWPDFLEARPRSDAR